MDKWMLFIFNICINSVLSFFTSLFLIKVIMILFRIKQGRASAFLRMIPILKLPLDMFLYDFSSWGYASGLHALIHAKGARLITVGISMVKGWIPLSSSICLSAEGKTFTVADMIGVFLSSKAIISISVTIMLISLALLMKKWIDVFHFSKALDKENSEVILFCQREVKLVRSCLAKSSPFVAGLLKPAVYIPENLLSTLTQKEYKAALGHELEHIRYKDPLMGFILESIRCLFWWIPIKKVFQKIREDQEIGCDAGSRRYGVDSVDLVSAIFKIAKGSSINNVSQFSYQLTNKPLQRRIEALLQLPSKRFKTLQTISCFAAVIIAFFLVLGGRLWIF